jgi:transcriptional regulator with XRE-family HTH domain
MSPDLKAYEGEALRVAQKLESLVRASRITAREVERRLGMGSGVLHRVFAGRISLKMALILAILDILEVKPVEFFKMVFEDPAPENASAALLRLLREVRITKGGDAAPAPPPSPPPSVLIHSEEELDQHIEAVLRRLGLLGDNEPLDLEEQEPPPKPPRGRKPRATQRRKKKTD